MIMMMMTTPSGMTKMNLKMKKNELSTEVTNEEISQGIKDEFGLIYNSK